jgi:hypothetical protein
MSKTLGDLQLRSVAVTNEQSGKTDWKWTFTMLLVVLGVAGVGWMTHYEIGRVYSQVESADQRMARVETAVHILADGQGEKTRTMVDQALTISQDNAASSAELLGNLKSYLNSGDKVRAAEIAYNAHVLLVAATESKSPVPTGYFARSVALLNELPAVSDSDIANRILSARVALAEYHSALQPDPELPSKQVTLKIRSGESIASTPMNEGSVYHVSSQFALLPKTDWQAAGAVVDGSAIPSGTDVLHASSGSLARNRDSIRGLTLNGVTQTLDGVEWKDVVFVNSRVRYRGGDLKLDNVRFVHCTFEVPENARGAQLADYATLESGALNIG